MCKNKFGIIAVKYRSFFFLTYVYRADVLTTKNTGEKIFAMEMTFSLAIGCSFSVCIKMPRG
jgi:hypothetical protein